MAGRIPEQFIEELIARVDIVDVIDSFVPLRKGGRDYVACCPFHNEKSPSFTVSREKQFFHCFGCGAHGTAIGFLMDYDHMDFVEAVHELAGRAGMQVPVDQGRQATTALSLDLYQLLGDVAQFYRRQLKEHPQSQRVIEYLKQRGLSGGTAGDYGIGFAPPGWDTLSQVFAPSQGGGASKTLTKGLIDAGLLIEKSLADGGQGRSYDRFRDRVMFPIRDTRGRVIGFGGRVLGDDSPKYLNSPETAVFHKGRELYGLYEARKSNRKLDRLLVVEGYMDVVMLAEHNIRYAVATLGTATTAEHLERMFRQVPEVVFCFDGDRAGREAAWRALENALPVIGQGRQARFMFLPDGEDPDSLVRQEQQNGFEKRMANAVPLSTFFFDALAERVDLQSIDGYARLVEMARPLLVKMQTGVFKQEIISRLAERTSMTAQDLMRELAGGTGAGHARHQPQVRRSTKANQPSLVRIAITLLLHYPALAQQAGELPLLRELDRPGVGLLVELLELLAERPHLTGAALLERWRDREEGRYLSQLAMQEVLLEGQEGAGREFIAALGKLRDLAKARRLEVLRAKSQSTAGLTDDEKSELKQLHGGV